MCQLPTEDDGVENRYDALAFVHGGLIQLGGDRLGSRFACALEAGLGNRLLRLLHDLWIKLPVYIDSKVLV